MAVPSFLFGGNTNETPDSIRRKRDLVRAIMGASNAPKNIGEGLNALGDGIVANVLDRRADTAEKTGTDSANSLFNSIMGTPTPGATGGSMPAVSANGTVPPVDLSGNDVYNGFIDTVKTGVTNPYGLAAVAATGRAESGYNPGNVNRTWDDPSESGKPGRAGGIMSWRGPRYDALAATGDLSPAGQGKFFLQEDPNLIRNLNSAKSVEEAQNMMNRAWAFRGYDKPGGEAGRRLSYAQGFLPKFQGQGGGQEVASLDPAAGMSPAPSPEAIQPPPVNPPIPAPTPGYVDPKLTAAAQQPPRAPMQGPTMQAPQLPAPTTIAAAPPVASVPDVQVAQAGPAALPAQTPAPSAVDPRLFQALSNPFLNPGQRAAVQALIQQQQQAIQNYQEEQTWRAREDYKTNSQHADPSYQLEQDYKRAQLEALKNKTGKSNLINAGEGNIYDPDTNTWIKAPSATGKTGDAFRFGGNSVEAQALNGLIESGQITADQAQQLGAGKTITDPSTGSMMFLTPQGIFKQQQGQQAQPQAQQQPYVDLFGDGGTGAAIPNPAPATAPPPSQAPQVSDTVSGGNPGIIPLTGGKPQKLLTENERKNQSLSSVIAPELKVVEDNFDALSDPKNQAYSRLPFSEFATTPEYQKAANSLQTIVSSYLYSVSGATATPEEVRKQTDILTPRPGESAESIANKKQRVRTMVNAVRQAGSLPALEEAAPVSDDIKAARDAIAKGAPRDKVIERLNAAGIDTTGL
jgi:hypothetical protein